MGTYPFSNNALVDQVFAKALDQLHLLLRTQAGDGHLDNAAQRDLIHGNEAVVVHVRKETHNKLAVHPIGDTSMSRNRITEILNLERAFETRGKETTEWCDERSECGEDEDMPLHWCHGESLDIREPDWEVVGVGHEDRIWSALETRPDVCSKVL